MLMYLSVTQGLLVLTLAIFYIVRPSLAYGITLYPAWIFGIILFIPALNFLRRKKLFLAHCLLLSPLFFVFSEEPRSLLRGIIPRREGSFRVVSLNCAGGEVSAAEEALSSNPDLVLLQESPNSKDIETLRQKHGYEAVVGLDGTILAKGTLTRVPLPKSVSNFSAAIWTPPSSKTEIFVVSLRMQPPIFRLDFMSRKTWELYRENKENRMVEMKEIGDLIQPLIQDRPLVIGGDFNTSPDKVIAEPLNALAEDTFAKVGTGWGGTGTNDYPVVRFDQIWLSKGLIPRTAWVQKTVNSDHRMVLASFDIQ